MMTNSIVQKSNDRLENSCASVIHIYLKRFVLGNSVPSCEKNKKLLFTPDFHLFVCLHMEITLK